MPDTRTRTTAISRQEWGSEHGRGASDPGPERRVVIHHSYRPALDEDATPATERSAIRGIERYHVESNGWAGIGYNWLVAPSGRIYEGRGWRFRGAHAGPVNSDSIGICLLIDGNTTEPGAMLVDAVRDLIADGITSGEISPDYVLSGHRDHMDRTCPGNKVYERLQEFRHDAGPDRDARPEPEPLPEPEPEISTPVLPGPGNGAALRLDRIEIPRREHIEEIARLQRASPEVLEPGLAAAETLLKGVAGSAGGEGKKLVSAAAKAIAAWRTR